MDNEELSRIKRIRKMRNFKIVNAMRNCIVLLIAVALFAFFSTGFSVNMLEKEINVNSFFSTKEYKSILNSSFKIIDRTYDSGTEKNLITCLADIAKSFTNIDFKEPINVFKARLPVFKAEFNNNTMQEPGDYENENRDNKPNKQKKQNPEDEKSKKNNKTHDNKKVERINKNASYERGAIKYSNLAGVKFNIEKLLAEGLSFVSDIRKKEILIYHTHTSEDYVDYGDFGVLQAGRHLKKFLEEQGVKSIHNATYHDKDFNTSYNSSFNTLSSVLKGNKDVDVIIDLHRDAVGNGKLTLVNEYQGKKYAQLMFVVGTDKTLDNPNWRENLKLAALLYDEMNSICPGIMRPLYLTTRRYNQHMSNGSILIEVGGDGNTIKECENSMKVFAQAIKKVLY